MVQKFYVRNDGSFVGSLVDTDLADAGPEYEGAIEVSESPLHAAQVWDFEAEKFGAIPPQPYELSKITIWDRTSEAEAEQIAAAMGSQSAKLQGIWNSAQIVLSDSKFFGDLTAFLTAVVGADRAAQLLAPEG